MLTLLLYMFLNQAAMTLPNHLKRPHSDLQETIWVFLLKHVDKLVVVSCYACSQKDWYNNPWFIYHASKNCRPCLHVLLATSHSSISNARPSTLSMAEATVMHCTWKPEVHLVSQVILDLPPGTATRHLFQHQHSLYHLGSFTRVIKHAACCP